MFFSKWKPINISLESLKGSDEKKEDDPTITKLTLNNLLE